MGDHLFSRTGFLDDSWFFRSYWIYGKQVDSNYGGWLRPGHFAPCARLMVFDGQRVYGFDRRPEYLCNASVQEYYVYAADRQVPPEGIERVRRATQRINAASRKQGAASSDWALRKKFSLSEQQAARFHWAAGTPPIQARAMVLAGRTLFLAGPPDMLDEEAALGNPDDPATRRQLEAQAAALAGKLGGQLLAMSADDGKVLASYDLGSMPVFDGMVAAGGRLLLATSHGKVVCLGPQGSALSRVPVQLIPLDSRPQESPVPPAAATGPSKAADFDRVVAAQVLGSEVGYYLQASGKRLGMALKRLPAPLEGKVKLSVRLRVALGGQLKNAFLLFGDSPEEARLVKCGIRYALRQAMIVEGPLAGGKTTPKTFEPDESRLYDLQATVDLKTGEVRMALGDLQVAAKLQNPLKSIAFVGCGALNSAMEFNLPAVSRLP